MTRINVVDPSELCDGHLLAEYHELSRIFTLAEKAAMRGEAHNDPKNPEVYTLGTGHCRFFYGRLGYLDNRHQDLALELSERGVNVQYTDGFRETFQDKIPADWWNDYDPPHEAVAINRQRIDDRMPKNAKWSG